MGTWVKLLGEMIWGLSMAWRVSRRMEILVPLSISKDVEWRAPIMREGANQIEEMGRTFSHTRTGLGGSDEPRVCDCPPSRNFKIKCGFLPWTIRTMWTVFFALQVLRGSDCDGARA